MSFSGPRPEVQGDYRGLDGLRIKDLPEIQLKEKEVIFTKIPTLIIVRLEISKSGHQYMTFLGEEGCEILKSYLDRRLKEGETLTQDSEIIATTASQAKKSRNFKMQDSSPFLASAKISSEIREAMRAVELPWRPYVFRSYFDTNLMLAESKGMISHAYQQFWMGHSGDMEAQYTTNKFKLPENVIEDMRTSYAKVSSNLLETGTKKGMTQDEVQAFINKKALMIAKYTQQEIDNLGKDLSQLTDAELEELIQRKQKASLGLNGNGNQMVIPFKEVKGWIVQGWEYVRDFPPDEAIIGLRNHEDKWN
jgi:hypothetical protein